MPWNHVGPENSEIFTKDENLMVLKTEENKIVCIVLHRSLNYNLYKLHYFS